MPPGDELPGCFELGARLALVALLVLGLGIALGAMWPT